MAHKHDIDDVLPHDLNFVKSFEESLDTSSSLYSHTFSPSSEQILASATSGEPDTDVASLFTPSLVKPTVSHPKSKAKSRQKAKDQQIMESIPSKDDSRNPHINSTPALAHSTAQKHPDISFLFRRDEEDPTPSPSPPPNTSLSFNNTPNNYGDDSHNDVHDGSNINITRLTIPDLTTFMDEITAVVNRCDAFLLESTVSLFTTTLRSPASVAQLTPCNKEISSIPPPPPTSLESPNTPNRNINQAGSTPGITQNTIIIPPLPTTIPSEQDLPLFVGRATDERVPSLDQLNRFSLVLGCECPIDYDILFKTPIADVLDECLNGDARLQSPQRRHSHAPHSQAKIPSTPNIHHSNNKSDNSLNDNDDIDHDSGNGTNHTTEIFQTPQLSHTQPIHSPDLLPSSQQSPLSSSMVSIINQFKTLSSHFSSLGNQFMSKSNQLLSHWNTIYTHQLTPYYEGLRKLYSTHNHLYHQYTSDEDRLLEQLHQGISDTNTYITKFTHLDSLLTKNLDTMLQLDRHYAVLKRNSTTIGQGSIGLPPQYTGQSPTSHHHQQQPQQVVDSHITPSLLTLDNRALHCVVSYLTPSEINNIMFVNYAHFKRFSQGDIIMVHLVSHINRVNAKVNKLRQEQTQHNEIFLSPTYKCSFNVSYNDLSSAIHTSSSSSSSSSALLSQLSSILSPSTIFNLLNFSSSESEGGSGDKPTNSNAKDSKHTQKANQNHEIILHLLQLCLNQLQTQERELQNAREDLQNKQEAQIRVNAFLKQQLTDAKTEHHQVKQQYDELNDQRKKTDARKLELIQSISEIEDQLAQHRQNSKHPRSR